MNGFALGGAATGFNEFQQTANQTNQVANTAKYQQGMLQIQQQAQQNQQQRELFARADKNRSELLGIVKQAIDAAQSNAALTGQPFDPSKVSAAVMPLVQQAAKLADSAGVPNGGQNVMTQFSVMLANAQAATKAAPQTGGQTSAAPAPSAPTGTPAPPGQNITSGEVTGVEYGPEQKGPLPQANDVDRLTRSLAAVPATPEAANVRDAIKVRLAQAIKLETPESDVHFMKTEDGNEIPLVIKKQGGNVSITDTNGNPYVVPTGDTSTDSKMVAEAIIEGKQPPVTTGLYRKGAAVRSELAKKGFDLTQANLEWESAHKQVLSLNGPQMVRYTGLAKSVINTVDEVNRLADEMKNSGVPLANAVKIQSYIQTAGNSPGGQLASRYLAAVNTLKEEFANLAQGGYAPTEAAWSLANQQINGNYGVQQLKSTLTEVQRLLRYRLQGIPNLEKLGPGSSNRYVPSGQGGQSQGGQVQDYTDYFK